jgi:hypothetical protein
VLLGDLPVKPAKLPNMNLARPAVLPHLIVFLLCLWSTVTLAVPKAADQEEDEVTFSEAGAPPRRTTQPYRSPAAGVATPSVRPAKSVHKPVISHARLERDKRHGKRLLVASKHRQLGKASGRMVKRAGNAPKFKSARVVGKPVRTHARMARFDQKRPHGARVVATGGSRTYRSAKVAYRGVKHAPAKPRRLEPRRTKVVARPAARMVKRHSGRAPVRR